MSKMQEVFDVGQYFETQDYEKIINYANETQENLIHNWQVKNREKLRHIILASRNILNFWVASIAENQLWLALVRCGAWIGALEAIERSVYEESMDMWLQKRTAKKISSIKHLPEILHLLEMKGVMTHGELTEKLNLNHPSTLTEIMKKIADLELITIQKSGKYKSYFLTDAGIRYARRIRTQEDEEAFHGKILRKYLMQMCDLSLVSPMQPLGSKEKGVVIKPGQDIGIITDTNKKMQNMKVANTLKEVSYDNKERPVLILKNKIEPVNFEMEA